MLIEKPVFTTGETPLSSEKLNQLADFVSDRVRPRGAWDTDADYLKNDQVTHNGSKWQALVDNSGVEPTEGATWTAAGGAGVTSWDDLEDKPTTLVGFGITDAASDAELAAEVAALEAADAAIAADVVTAQSAADDAQDATDAHAG